AITPLDKSFVATTTATVTSITAASLLGAFTTYLNDGQSNLPMHTIIIIHAITGISFYTTRPPSTLIKNIRNELSTNVDSRALTSDFTLIIDCPIIAHPAIPPKNPVIVLAIPWPLASLFLLLSVPVISSTIEEVSKDSSSPTIDRAMEYGKIIDNVSNVNGTSGIKNDGNVLVIEPKSPTVRKSMFV